MSFGVCSLPFLLFVGVFSGVFRLCRDRRRRLLALSAANVLALAAWVPDLRSWFWLALCVFASYGALRSLKARPKRSHLMGLITLSVLGFVYLKDYSFVRALLPLVLSPEVWVRDAEVVGLSFMLFKFIHMAVDQAQGQLESYSFFSYASYQLSFFTLVAGPIQRYNDFHAFWLDTGRGEELGATAPSAARDALGSWGRLLTGTLKMGLLSTVAWSFFQDAGHSLGVAKVPGAAAALFAGGAATGGQRAPADLLRHFAVYFYAYPFYMYFNFSGYTDMMIGAAGLLGLRLPENFNHPFVARNVIDYWNRWHISLTHWVRDYVFMTSFKAAAEKFPAWNRWWGYFLLFVSLFLTGVWHGTTSAYVAFGLLHGLGASANRAYADWLKARFGRAGVQQYEKNRFFRIIAVVLTFHFVAFCFLFFSSGIGTALGLLRLAAAQLATLNLIALGRAATFPVAAVFFVVASVGFSRATGMGGWLAARSEQRGGTGVGVPTLYLAAFGKAVAVVLVFLAVWAIEGRGPVVEYMRF